MSIIYPPELKDEIEIPAMGFVEGGFLNLELLSENVKLPNKEEAKPDTLRTS